MRRKIFAGLIIGLIIAVMISSGAFAEESYDPQHTMQALNMAVVSVHRILTTESRAVLEQEYDNIISNIAQGNIASDPEMLALFLKLQDVISSRRLRDNDKKRIQDFHDMAEKRRITYALSAIRLAEAKADSTRKNIEGIDRETSARLRASENNINDIRRDIGRIETQQAGVVASWLGNMAYSCVSLFMGDISSAGGMFWNTLDAYGSYKALAEEKEYSQRQQRRAENDREIMRVQRENLRQSAENELAQIEVMRENLKEQMKHDGLMLQEELKNSQWRLERRELEECNELQQRLLASSWNLWNKYKFPDEYMLKQDMLEYFYGAIQEKDPAKSQRMLRSLEYDFSVYPPYWFYRAKSAQALGNDVEAEKCFAKFNEVWRPVLRRDPYMLEAAKYRIVKLSESGKSLDEIRPAVIEQLRIAERNTAPNDWADNLFIGIAYYLMGEKDRGLLRVMSNIDREHEKEISGKIVAQMEKGALNASSLRDELAVWQLQFGDVDSLSFGDVMRLAEMGYAEAQFRLGKMYHEGLGIKQDFAEALKWYHRAIEQGHAKAQNNLGLMYNRGEGVKQDYAEAAKWYRKSAEQGNATAQSNLGNMYYNGYGVQKDYAEAAKWYRKSAEQGIAQAQNNLGVMYSNGVGVKQDYAEAAKWYRKSAEQGLAQAQFGLGYMYHNGYGVQQDYAEAAKWYRKSAEQGNATAQSNLGNMYYNGYGVQKDYAEAAKWYRKSAEQGNLEAQYNLGQMYYKGYGVKQDYSEAVKWYRKAAAQGYTNAKEALKRLGERP